LQVKPQLVPLQVAAPLAGTEQDVQEAPQLLVPLFDWQVPLQSCVPAGHTPLHDWFCGMQDPAQSFWPVGQLPPQDVPSQVAAPPVGTGQALHVVPQVAASLLLAQVLPQAW
jgi:hypothetical protein